MWNIVIGIVIVVGLSIIQALFYKPPPGPKASKLKDFNIPQSNEGDAIYDFAGSAWIKDAHVAWYGDLKTKGIYKKGGKK